MAEQVKNPNEPQKETPSPTQPSLDYIKLAEALIAQETSEEMLRIRQLILLRTAMEGEIKNTKVPAPLNITEVGGYYNLLEKQNETTMLRQLVSSALGLPNDYAPQLTETAVKGLLEDIIRKLQK